MPFSPQTASCVETAGPGRARRNGAPGDAYVKKCDLAFRLTTPQDFSLPRLTRAFHTDGRKETLRPFLLSEWLISQVRF